MVAAIARHETIFTVLGDSARARARRALTTQLGVCVALGITLAFTGPGWWPAAALSMSGGLHAAWGIVTQRLERTGSTARAWHRYLAFAIAGAGSVAAAVGLIGLALAAFTGTGRGTYDACGRGSHVALCQAYERPVPTTKLPIP